MKTLFGYSNFVSSVDGSEVIQQAAISNSPGNIISTNKAYKLQWSNGPHTEPCVYEYTGWSNWSPNCPYNCGAPVTQTRNRSLINVRNQQYPQSSCTPTLTENKNCNRAPCMTSQNQQHVAAQMIGGM